MYEYFKLPVVPGVQLERDQVKKINAASGVSY